VISPKDTVEISSSSITKPSFSNVFYLRRQNVTFSNGLAADMKRTFLPKQVLLVNPKNSLLLWQSTMPNFLRTIS
jgi:hypothetical protein